MMQKQLGFENNMDYLQLQHDGMWGPGRIVGHGLVKWAVFWDKLLRASKWDTGLL